MRRRGDRSVDARLGADEQGRLPVSGGEWRDGNSCVLVCWLNKQTYKPRLRLIVAKMSLMISSFFGSNDGMMFRRWMLQIFSSTWSCTIFWSSFRFSIEKNTSAHHTPSPHAPSKFRSWMLSMWWFRIAVRITFSCSSLSFDSAPHLSLPPPLMKLSTSMFRTLPHSRNAFSTSQ